MVITKKMKIPFSVYDFFGYLSAGFIVLYAADFTFGFGFIATKELGVQTSALLAILSYTVGHLVANISSFILEHTIARRLLGAPETILLSPVQKTFLRLIFPIYYKPFPGHFIEVVLNKAKSEGFTEVGRSLFFHCHSIAKKDNATNERLSTFLNLYGFSRNMCMACIICAVLMGIGASLNPAYSDKFLLLGLVALFLAIGLFYRYLKFYKHYTEEVFRTYETEKI